jgi:hypothetical protein
MLYKSGNKWLFLAVVLALLAVMILPASLASAQSPPGLPAIFWGSITINGSNAPVGTQVTAKINDVQQGSYTVSTAGSYGDMLVQNGNEGDTVQFYINGSPAQTAVFHPGYRNRVDLSLGGGGTPPSAPSLSSPSNGATGVSMTPTLQWNAPSGASSYQVQVATSSLFTTIVFDQSGITNTQVTVSPALSPSTQYYWRANATNAYGTSDWSSTWSFTTAPCTPPAAPTLSSPADLATGISTTPTLQWNSVSGAVSYTVQVATSSSFTSLVFAQPGVTSTQVTVTPGLVLNTMYFWRVNATNSCVATSPWSSYRRFTTTNGGGVPVPPAFFRGTVYVNDIATSGASVVGYVGGSPAGTTTSGAGGAYVLQVSGISGSTVTFTVNGGLATETSTMNPGWMTRLDLHSTGPVPPPAPILSLPADAAAGVPITPSLQWNASIGATSYQAQVSTSSGFGGTPPFNQSGITATQVTVSPALSYSTLYYWRVNATNASGTSAWSTVWSFTTGPCVTPSAPILSLPADTATDVSITPSLQWNASSGATSYRAQVSTTSGFTNIVSDQSGIASTQVTVSPALSNSTLYYWRVNASNSCGTSGWSTPVWSFTTTGTCVTPSAPVLSSPTDNATGVSTTPNLQWNASSGATSYRAQVSTSSGFGTTVFNQSGITATQVTVSPALSASTLYYWRVNATNSCGTSGWSTPVWSFTTGTTPPPNEKLVGIASTLPYGGYTDAANQFLVAPFTAEGTGSMTKFRIYCAGSGNVKVAIYNAAGTLLSAVDSATPVSFGPDNYITLDIPVSITAGDVYQLAAVSDTLIGRDSGSYYLYKTQTFTGFTFPTTLPSGFNKYDSRVPIFAGYK